MVNTVLFMLSQIFANFWVDRLSYKTLDDDVSM